MSEVVYLITHDELPHCDDVACIALFNLYFKTLGISTELIRTRDEDVINSYKDNPNAIIFDIGGGELDHHEDELTPDGRNYSSIGKVWAKYKESFKNVFRIDERSWKCIDLCFISFIDETDNTGKMNPFTYYFNIIRGLTSNKGKDEESLKSCIDFMEVAWSNILTSENIRSKERLDYDQLPTIRLFGLLFKYNDNPNNFIPMGQNYKHLSGYIWRTKNNTFSIRRAWDNQMLLKPGLLRDDELGIIFTHKTGFMGEVTELKYISNILNR